MLQQLQAACAFERGDQIREKDERDRRCTCHGAILTMRTELGNSQIYYTPMWGTVQRVGTGVCSAM
jgi:hypothetical protein